MNLVLTGSSSGIGRAIAEHLLSKGHKVWGIARSAQPELSAKHGSHFKASACDVSDWSGMARVAEEVASTWGHVDGLVACAGIQGEIGRLVDSDPTQWSHTVRANLDGTFYTLRAFYPLLKKASRRAKVVAFSGGGATKPRLHFSAYGVAKTGVVRLIETAAEELKAEPIDLNTIAPGAINTRLTEEVLALGPDKVGQAEYHAAVKQKASGGSSLEKAVGCVDWLLSPASDGVSGRLISAPWDPWATLGEHREALAKSDIYTLRRIVAEERGKPF